MYSANGTASVSAGVIGLGQIGGGVAICLARAKRELSIYDVRADAAVKLAGVPPISRSPADVARSSNVVLVAVVDAAQVAAVLQGPEGLLAGAHPNLVVVLLSTVDVAEIEPIARMVEAAGAKFLDCGVLGGSVAADKGLVSLVGGDATTISYVKPVLDDFSAKVIHMGELGAGMRAKLACNIVAFSRWRAVYEAALLAEAADIDLYKLTEALDANVSKQTNLTAWIRRGTVKPLENCSLEETAKLNHVLLLLRKDIGAALMLAGRLGVDLPLAKVTYDTGAEIFGLRP